MNVGDQAVTANSKLSSRYSAKKLARFKLKPGIKSNNMSNQSTKYIGQRPVRKPVSKLDTLRDTWTVMRPFVHFSYKAIKLLAHTFIFIVKNIPKPEDVKRANQKSDKVIKI